MDSLAKSVLAKINKFKSWQVALIIVFIGFAVFFTGLNNPFQGDDTLQIVSNIPVHSITNIKIFFEGGTFYNGKGLAPLAGQYYRPLTTTVFSLIYTVFGAHQFYYHFFQLLFYLGSGILLYLFFRKTFNTVLALLLCLIFIIHPLDSQTVFAIPQMQDVLFFFFGILGLYLLSGFKSVKSLILVAFCLFLSLLSKETGIGFIVLSLLYLFWWNRKRLFAFAAITIVPFVLWLMLRIHAVGINPKPMQAPIDKVGLIGRLFTAPSILQFYLTKFIFPWKLASGYYWVHSSFSVRYVLIPLLVDLAVIGLVIYLSYKIRNRVSKSVYHKYLFFMAWTVIGLLTLLQIIPLDMTACETYFYFSMAGLLGMIGVGLTTFQAHLKPSWFLLIAILIIGVLGVRTALRGEDWSSKYKLDFLDIAASKENYVAYSDISYNLINRGDFAEGAAYAERSIKIFPYLNNYTNLGVADLNLLKFGAAEKAYQDGLKYGSYLTLYEDLGGLTLVYGNTRADQQTLARGLSLFPTDNKLWFYLAVFDGKNGDNKDAKTALAQAVGYGYPVPQALYDAIMDNQPYSFHTTVGVIQIQ
jgi:hypothetical protein